MEGIKTSQAQLKAIKTWQDKNKEQTNYIKNRSSCKSFIKNKATIEDLNDIEKLIKEVKASKYNNIG